MSVCSHRWLIDLLSVRVSLDINILQVVGYLILEKAYIAFELSIISIYLVKTIFLIEVFVMMNIYEWMKNKMYKLKTS